MRRIRCSGEMQPTVSTSALRACAQNERLGNPLRGIAMHPEGGVIRFESLSNLARSDRADQHLAHTSSRSPSSACAVISGPAPGPWITSGWLL